MTDEERYDSKVDKTAANGCWTWTAGTTYGYGKFSLNGRSISAHRIALFGMYGPNLYDRGLIAAHACDNPPCVNPDHLFICTVQGNNSDMQYKGRSTKGRHVNIGSKHPQAKLTESGVRDIKRVLASSEHTQRAIAKMFGVSRPTIANIKAGRQWAHV